MKGDPMNKYDEIQGKACSDCLMLIANGDTSGNLRCETEEGEAAYRQDVADRTPEGSHGWVPTSWPYDPEMIGNTGDGDTVPNDGGTYEVDADGDIWRTGWTDEDRYYGTDVEGSFSSSSCDVCGETLGGDRHPVVALIPAS